MDTHTIHLSVITIAGNDQLLHNGVLDGLRAQTFAEPMELIVVGLGTRLALPEPDTDSLAIIPLWLGSEYDMLSAQLAAINQARGTVIAFLEDHCIPQPDWAQQVHDACTRRWDAVAYAMINGSPDTWTFRSVFLAEYGVFAHPAHAVEITVCPDGNGAYHRETLLPVLNALKPDPTGPPAPAFTWHLATAGLRTAVEPQAVAAHKSFARLSDLFRVHVQLSRLYARHRVCTHQWRWYHRLLYALAVPLLLPWLQVYRLVTTLGWRHPHLKHVVSGLPLIFALHLANGIGEGMGYLSRRGPSLESLRQLELDAGRA
jgi:hypothetical protein